MHALPIGFETRRAHEGVGRGQEGGNRLGESEQTDIALPPRFGHAAFPVGKFRPGTRDDEVCVPTGVLAALAPGVEEYIEALAAVVAKSADERHQGPIQGQAEHAPRISPLGGTRRTELLGVDPVIDRVHSPRVKRDAGNQSVFHQVRIRDDKTRFADSLPFPPLIAPPFPSHPLAVRQRRSPGLRHGRVVDIMNPVNIIPEAIATVHHDGAADARNLPGDLPSHTVQERLTDHVAAKRPRHSMPDHV